MNAEVVIAIAKKIASQVEKLSEDANEAFDGLIIALCATRRECIPPLEFDEMIRRIKFYDDQMSAKAPQ